MLEPWTPADLAPTRLRALAVRHGVDLEPQLPDPAPAYVDPEGALHPALTEPIGSLLLHPWPTPGARAALVGRLLTEPGRVDSSDPQDPFVRLARFAEQQHMEPEIRGALALLLVRGWLAREQRRHRPVLPDPVRALQDPNLDAWRHKRARLDDTPWRPLLDVVVDCARQLGDHEALAFEGVVVASGARWLTVYARWWEAARLLGVDERIPSDPTALRSALAGVRRAMAHVLGAPPDAPISALLAETLKQGCAAEASFVETVVARPDGPITAKWLLERQIRSMRNLLTATRQHALDLHRLLRESDVLRLTAHVGWRVARIELWLADVAGVDPSAQEAALLAIPDPAHETTLAAGLGRIRGMVLLRRLRRGWMDGAETLAGRALDLAPEELAVRITDNDMRFQAGVRDAALLASLRAEHARWDSLSVCVMGARVAEALDDPGRARHFRDDLVERALLRPGADRWLLAVGESLRSPKRRQDAALLDRLIEHTPSPPHLDSSLSRLLLGPDDAIDEAIADAEEALLAARLSLTADEETRSAAVPAISRKKRGPAWERIVEVPPTAEAGPQWEWLQRLRAAAEELRRPPTSTALRALSSALSRAADLGVPAAVAPQELCAAALLALDGADPNAAAATWASQAQTLERSLRAPREARLHRELRRLRAEARLNGDGADVRVLSDLAAVLAGVEGAADPEAELQGVDEALREIDVALHAPQDAIACEAAGLMRTHPDFDRFSLDELQIRPDALRRAHELVRLFNVAGGQRDRRRLKGAQAEGLYELRHRTRHLGGLRVFYRRHGDGWQALAAMSKYDDRPQRAAINRVLTAFVD